ncbi:MAG: hypothetical protein AMJ93_08225 [Anaerolineae bacterium SM23_84]|jgi:DegV family protein with EDD domain|nr:MAG: hypothetical protein AMJ93_08225 [Anaerolineae bacterium SM23_84]
MRKVAVVTDAVCGLPGAIVEQYGITVVPVTVRFGTKVYRDDQLTIDEFWVKVLDGPHHPSTSQPSPGDFETAFGPLVDQGLDIVCPVVTSKLSGTFNSARVAAQGFPGRVTVFDTQSWSLVQGYQVMSAAAAAQSGASVEEIIVLLESIRSRSHVFIGFETVEYIQRGGRIDDVMPVLERLVRTLKLRFVFEIAEGKLRFVGVSRSRLKLLQQIQAQVARYIPAEMLIVAHTRRENEAQDFARTLAKRLDFPLGQVMVGELGPALASHAGPGGIAAGIVRALPEQ